MVIDNGPAIESVAAACWFAHRPHFTSWPDPDSPVSSHDESHWVLWRLRCALGFARSACLISGTGGGVTDLVFDGREHAERRVSPLPVVEDLKVLEDGIGGASDFSGE